MKYQIPSTKSQINFNDQNLKFQGATLEFGICDLKFASEGGL